MPGCKIVGFVQIFNELEKGNLERFIKHVPPLLDAWVAYDDGSTDGSYEYVKQYTPYVIRGAINDFIHEINHKQQLLEIAVSLNPDFILWLDCDEVLTANANRDRLIELCEYCIKNDLDGVSLHELNLWRSYSWQRIDSEFGNGWKRCLWRVKPSIKFDTAQIGLHKRIWPIGIEKVDKVFDIAVLHFGFASIQNIAHKYWVYRTHGQRGYHLLDRLMDEENLITKKIEASLLPDDMRIEATQPIPRATAESFANIYLYRKDVFRPKFSIACLIYKSVEWLKFINDQVLRYTDLTNKEFYFIANDASQDVRDYLRNNYIRHYIWKNNPDQQREWYINNVYRAWNYAANQAKGDFIIFINSDMAFWPGWFDNLWAAYNGSNCIVSRLVESGKLPSGQYGIKQYFGDNFQNYQESEFQKYAAAICENRLANGGLFMPLLIRKEHFLSVGGYPEGNVVPGSDIFNPTIAKSGEPMISGDLILMEKLATRGIQHQTAFNSIVYHFQEGEMRSKPRRVNDGKTFGRVVLCNDRLTGIMGERVLWNYLLDTIPGVVGVDQSVVVPGKNWEVRAKEYIKQQYPNAKVIIQNASFMDIVDSNLYTVSFLQDNLRDMGTISMQQENNLRLAHKLVTNSFQTASAYPEYDFMVIPVGVDADLFKPMDKTKTRCEIGIPEHNQVGIFVGNFSEVKGWSKIQQAIEAFPNIYWILVSNRDEIFNAPNTVVYNKISQQMLAKLYNCADFFIIGSPVETQCLAAVEACLCGLPIIMRNTGIFKEFTASERSQVGIFGEDFLTAIQNITLRTFDPRNVMLQKEMTIQQCVLAWQRLLEEIFLELYLQEQFKSEKPVKRRSDQELGFLIEFYFRYKILKRFLGHDSLTMSLNDQKSMIKYRMITGLKRSLPDPVYSIGRSIYRRIKKIR